MQQIANYGHDTAENILWHPQENALYWLDIPQARLFRGHFPNLQKEAEQFDQFESRCILEMAEPIGGFVFVQPQTDCKPRFLLFASAGHIYEWKYERSSEQQTAPQLYVQVDPKFVPNRFNDVFALPLTDGGESRYVLCGTMPSEGNADSRLLLFDVEQRSTVPVQDNLKLANGMGLSPDRQFLYFADTRDFAIYRFPVQDLAQGQMDWESRHKFIDFCGRLGRPDGLCVDREGRLWVAETGAGMITCFDGGGKELGCLPVGTEKVTSCCLGGNRKQILFVSTQGGVGRSPREIAAENIAEKAGGIFALHLGHMETASKEAELELSYTALRSQIGEHFCGQEEVLVKAPSL